MDHSISYSQKDFTSNNSSNRKMEFWVDTDEDGAKYRDIPVLQTLDEFNTNDIYCENVLGVKERKISSNILKRDAYKVKSTSILSAEVKARINKKRTKLDPAISVNALQLKHYSDHSFMDRMGQGSVSEPTLCNAKDRGDSINLQDFYRDDKSHSQKCFGDGKIKTSKDRGVGGYIYVKSGGKVYKSTIDSRNFQAVDDVDFSTSGTKQEKHKKHISQNCVPWIKMDSKAHGTDYRQGSKEELDDFEIAIFLSGVGNISEKSQKRHRKHADNRKKEEDLKMKQERKGKRKKKNARKNETTLVLGKKIEMESKTYHAPTKILTIDPYAAKKNFLNDQIVKSRIQLKFSSESEGEYILELPDKSSNPVKRLPNFERNTTNLKAITSNENKGQDTPCRYKSKKNEIVTYRSKGTPQSSCYHFSDVYKTPKKKVCDEELWEKFEAIFRSYASTTRHSGEVIPRKISTEWMINAGVVDEVMTEKEADDAFRQAAGAKITMNTQEYKEFLIMLTLRMKLPYYEIYRRMCGI